MILTLFRNFFKFELEKKHGVLDFATGVSFVFEREVKLNNMASSSKKNKGEEEKERR